MKKNYESLYDFLGGTYREGMDTLFPMLHFPNRPTIRSATMGNCILLTSNNTDVGGT